MNRHSLSALTLAALVSTMLLSSVARAEGEASYVTAASTYLTGTGIPSLMLWAGATMAIVAAIWLLKKLGGR
jgi:hypothetical protein